MVISVDNFILRVKGVVVFFPLSRKVSSRATCWVGLSFTVLSDVTDLVRLMIRLQVHFGKGASFKHII